MSEMCVCVCWCIKEHLRKCVICLLPHIGVEVSPLCSDLDSFESVTRNGTTGSYWSYIFHFLRACILISMVFVLIYIPTSWVHIMFPFSLRYPYEHCACVCCLLMVATLDWDGITALFLLPFIVIILPLSCGYKVVPHYGSGSNFFRDLLCPASFHVLFYHPCRVLWCPHTQSWQSSPGP